MPKLLMITTVYNTLRTFLLPYARHYRQQGWVVEGMAQGISGNPDCVETFDKVHEMAWSRNPLRERNLTQAPRQVQEVVEAGQYDIVHVHTAVAGFVTRLSLRKLRQQPGAPIVIYTTHGFRFHDQGSWAENWPPLLLEKMAGKWTDYLVVINREDHAAAQLYGIVPSHRLMYMPGIGVDLQRYVSEMVPQAEVDRVHQELGLGENGKLFTMVGRLEPLKRHEDLLQAVTRLRRPDVHIAMAGEGPRVNELQALAEKMGICSQIHFLGYRRDLPAILKCSEALVLPSEREGVPRSVMEAMALEVPVIGTDVRGTRQLLEDGCGFLYQLGDIGGLAQSLEKVINTSAGELQQMTTQARQRVQDYRLDRLFDLHDQLYARALEQR